jgi:hypothetical protein
MQRCTNPDNPNYGNYGGRGISIHDEWRDSVAFMNWVIENLGDRPEGLTLDRIDNECGYEPGNLRWATRKEQIENRRQEQATFKNTCLHCNYEFLGIRSAAQYCSSYCQKSAWRKRMAADRVPTAYAKRCTLCGGEFISRRSDTQYCSSRCQSQAGRARRAAAEKS